MNIPVTNLFLTTVPKYISKNVIKLCDLITKETKPVYIPIISVQGTIINDCYLNVEKYIKNNTGRIQYGWQIWEWPKVLIEAEFHAVWVSPQNILYDITPKPLKIDKILFLSDNKKKYQGVQIDNIRIPLTKDKLIDEYISFSKMFYKLTNEGELAYKHGKIILNDEMNYVLSKKSDLQNILKKKYYNRNSPCHCGSGQKFKNCCL